MSLSDLAAIGSFVSGLGFKAYWALRHHWLSPDFQQWYDALSAQTAHPVHVVS